MTNRTLQQAKPCLKPSARTKSKQRSRIYNLLLSARGGWVPAVALGRIALSYTRNVLELRRAGCVIENKIEMQPDGSKHGFYRLVTRREETSAAVEYWQDAQPEQAELVASPKPPATAWQDPETQRRGA